jgi:hypothetical protein
VAAWEKQDVGRPVRVDPGEGVVGGVGQVNNDALGERANLAEVDVVVPVAFGDDLEAPHQAVRVAVQANAGMPRVGAAFGPELEEPLLQLRRPFN